MAARLSGISTVSYGIGVQNRYSAFLDDEEGFISPSKTIAPKVSASNKRVDNNSLKQKSQSSSSSSSAKPASNNVNSNNKNLASSTNGSTNRNGKVSKQDQTPENKNQGLVNNGKRQRSGNQQQQNQQHGFGLNRKFGRPGNFNNDQKSQSNGNSNHQMNASQSTGKDDHENHQQHGSKYAGNNYNNGLAPRNRQRNSYHDNDTKRNEPLSEANGCSSIGHQSSEEEKRRRQQKRFLDLKHKDPEKREARQQRQQLNNADGSSTNVNGTTEQVPRDSKTSFRGSPRNSGPNPGRGDDSSRPGGPGRGRGRRPDQGRELNNGTRQENGQTADGQPTGRNGTQQQRNNRMPRNRNGLGLGSRGSRGPKGDGEQGGRVRDSENHKPIPNFSDKSDFPSLAS